MIFIAKLTTQESDSNKPISITVKAADFDGALTALRRELFGLKHCSSHFLYATKIYLEAIIGIATLPDDSAISWTESRTDDGLTVFKALRGYGEGVVEWTLHEFLLVDFDPGNKLNPSDPLSVEEHYRNLDSLEEDYFVHDC